MKSVLLNISKVVHLVTFSRKLSALTRAISSKAHKLQFFLEWSHDNPEHFDHNIDLYYKWKKTRASFPMERGVWSAFALSQNGEKGNTLDLCCGDGFYSFYFYSHLSSKVTSIDFEESAISQARQMHHSENIEYLLGDIRKHIPDGPFDNIMWDAAIEHFTENEIQGLMARIKKVLSPNGILSGYTIVEDHSGDKRLHQHEYEFHNKEDLSRFLTPYFKNVVVMQNKYEERENLYFYASDGDIPFQKQNFLYVCN